MNKRRSPQTYKEFLQVLFELFEEIEPNTPEQISAYLDDRGFDRSALISSLKTGIEDAIGESPLNWRNKTGDLDRQTLKAPQSIREHSQSRQDLIAAIRSIYAKRQIPMVAHYRNLEEVSDEDLLSLLEDLQELDDEQ